MQQHRAERLRWYTALVQYSGGDILNDESQYFLRRANGRARIYRICNGCLYVAAHRRLIVSVLKILWCGRASVIMGGYHLFISLVHLTPFNIETQFSDVTFYLCLFDVFEMPSPTMFRVCRNFRQINDFHILLYIFDWRVCQCGY